MIFPLSRCWFVLENARLKYLSMITLILQIEKVLEMKKMFLHPVPFWSVAISARKINLGIDFEQEVSLSHISE